MEKELTPEQFTLRAIDTLKKEPYKGIHSVYSGFNTAFKAYFPSLDPVATTKALKAAGKIDMSFARGGVTLYHPGDQPERKPNDGKATLAKMGLGE